MELWDHQKRAIENVDKSYRAGNRRIVLRSPTGGGKTRIAIKRMLNPGRRFIFYTNRTMLFDQTSENFHDWELNHGLISPDHETRPMERVQLAMIQTQISRFKKSDELPVADEIIVDEAHNNAGPEFRRILNQHRLDNPDLLVLGMSATPLGIGDLYDDLVNAGTNRELRECGSHVKHGAKIYAPDEPDVKLVGKVDTTTGEVGIPGKRNRKQFTKKVFGRIVDHYKLLNPERRPAVLFAPGVDESKWFCQHLQARGITAAHIDAEYCLIGEQVYRTSTEVKKEIEERVKAGSINIVCNRFVLREGIDWPFLYHGIFATIFGSLTSYIQAAGRLLRNHTTMDHIIIQDHGGNYWRHGSINHDREWVLSSDNSKEAGIIKLRNEEREKGPDNKKIVVCRKCGRVRQGLVCPGCGDSWIGSTRIVLQSDGSLKQMPNKAFQGKRTAIRTKRLESNWSSYALACMNSKKPHIARRSFAEIYNAFARNNRWQYPPRNLPFMPKNKRNWIGIPAREVPKEELY